MLAMSRNVDAVEKLKHDLGGVEAPPPLSHAAGPPTQFMLCTQSYRGVFDFSLGMKMWASELNSLMAIRSGIRPLSRINTTSKGGQGKRNVVWLLPHWISSWHEIVGNWRGTPDGNVGLLGREIRGCFSPSPNSPPRVWVGTFHWHVGRISCCPLEHDTLGQPQMNVVAVVLHLLLNWHRHSEKEATADGTTMPEESSGRHLEAITT